jgi:hypothetical protein
MISGYIGLTIMIIAYIILNTSYSKYFLHLNILAGLFLIHHSVLIKDMVWSIIATVVILLQLIKISSEQRVGENSETGEEGETNE